MPMTMDQLRTLVERQNLNYFVDPQRPAVLLGVRGVHGSYRFVIALQVDGRFVQFRSLDYLHCTTEHSHLAEVLQVLGAINYRKRLVKFGWDPSDGEIVAYADVWIMDGTLTDDQFRRMLDNYMPAIDMAYARIRTAMETGADPGEEDPLRSLEEAEGGLPGPLRKLLEKLRGGDAGEGEAEEEEDGDGEPGFSTI